MKGFNYIIGINCLVFTGHYNSYDFSAIAISNIFSKQSKHK